MYIVFKLRDYDGHSTYNAQSVIGVYDDFQLAKHDLLQKMSKLKYTHEIEFDDDDDEYFFAHVTSKNSVEITSGGMICFEILKKNMELNEIRLRS